MDDHTAKTITSEASQHPKIIEMGPSLKLNWYEKVLAQHGHPTKLILDTLGYIWGVYFLWHHDLTLGLLALFVVGGLGSALTRRTDRTALARTPVGRFFLIGAQPLNFILQIPGHIVVLYGTWQHSAFTVLTGVTLVLLGHLSGWERVKKRLADQRPS